MHVERVQIDAADPVQVYRLVRRHLRTERGERSQASPCASPLAYLDDGLAGTPTAQRRRRSMSVTTTRRSRPTKGGLYFTDFFRNNHIEQYWTRNTLQSEALVETNIVEDQYTGIYTDGAGSGGFPANFMRTAAERYADVRVRAEFYFSTLSDAACVAARCESDGSDLTAGYLLSFFPASGAVQLTNVSGGVETVMASTTIAPRITFRLDLVCLGDQISGYVDLALVVGPVTVALFDAGHVGFGSRIGAAEWVCTRFQTSAP